MTNKTKCTGWTAETNSQGETKAVCDCGIFLGVVATHFAGAEGRPARRAAENRAHQLWQTHVGGD